MDEDNRPNDSSEEEESDAGWYFDLPQGAWERQEAKNRELRQSVRRNMDSEPKREAFSGRTEASDLNDEDELPSWGSPRADERADEAETPAGGGGGWALPSELEPRAESPAESAAEYSTEPITPADIPLKLRSQRLPDEDEQPALKPPPGLFGDFQVDSPWSADSDAASEPNAAEPAPHEPAAIEPAAPGFGFRTRMQTSSDEPDEPRPFARGDIEPEQPVEQPRSRWGEIFSEKASDGASMLDSMRAWAHSSEAAPTDAVNENEEPELASPEAPALDAGPAEPAAIPIRLQHRDDDETPLVNTENPQTRWDQMFGRKASDDAGLLDGMRAWATKPQDDDVPGGPPRMRLTDDAGSVDDELFKPFEWEQEADQTEYRDTGPSAEAGEPVEKKGLFGKLFGKKRSDDQDAPQTAAASLDAPWPPGDEMPQDFPTELSFTRGEESDRGSWLGRSDGAENRFRGAEEPEPEETFGWAPVAEPDETPAWPPSERDSRALDQTTPAPGVGSPPIPDQPAADEPLTERPWSFTAGTEDEESPAASPAPQMTVGSDEPDDDMGWNPEPFEAPVAPAASIQPPALADQESEADAVADWLIDEPTSASLVTGVEPAAEEDPWKSVEQVEDEAVAVDGIAAEETNQAWDASTALGDAAPAPSAATDVEPDDPWAAYMAGRGDAQPAGDATAPNEAAAAGSEPVAGTNETEPAVEGSLWDSAFARIHGDEDAVNADDPAPATADQVAETEDDPWAAIAQASGFEPGSEEIAIFRGSAEVEDALQRYEAEREAEEAVGFTAPEAFPAAVDDEGAGPPAALPTWDDSKVGDDTVLRAFEAHASLYEDDDEFSEMSPSANDTEPVVFDELLGEDADEIVAEASEPATENKYFGRMQGWAPQRTTDHTGTVFPWEADRQDREARQPFEQQDEEPVLEGWSRVEEPPPPWTTTNVASHAEAGPSARRKSRSRMLVREIVETGLLALLVFLAVRASFQNFKVDGLSMYPTLEDGEYLIVNKLAYAEVDMDRLGNFVPFVSAGDDPTREVFGGPERGDIVVLEDPREENTDLIKRIIGLPGETIEIVDGEVYINDMLLIEPYIRHEWDDTKDKIVIPEGFYFVMGDNRSNSLDSRSDQIGLISRDLIIGKAALTYWPRDKFGLAPNESADISEKDGRPTVTAQTIQD